MNIQTKTIQTVDGHPVNERLYKELRELAIQRGLEEREAETLALCFSIDHLYTIQE